MSNRNSSAVIKRTQFSLMLTWAYTVHKVQGIGLPQIVVSFQLQKQRNFQYEQIYLALSRIMSFEGLYILDSFTVKTVRANPRALEEYNRLLSESMLVNFIDKKGLMITLLDIKSLNKYAVDLVCNERLKRGDIICSTETRIQQNLSLSKSHMLEKSNMIHNNNLISFKALLIVSEMVLAYYCIRE